MDICSKALSKQAIELGIDGSKEFVCDKWSVNSKRKGITFRGFKNDDNQLIEKESNSGQGVRKSQYVSKGGKR